MESTFLFIGVYLVPILSIIFCLNLVTIIKKAKRDEQTIVNTIWLTTSFVLITWSIAIMSSVGI
ncbi:hypothetical protein AC739_17735 [Planococcus glaciei]|nr:hypothetical protein AC739_17735 [Planococcus glaciei]MCP2034684.1 hypothetical protein [Planomicrobium sp. HSC-17F08]